MQAWTEDDPVIWTAARIAGACRLTELSGFDADHRLTRGESLLPEWPSNVRYAMDPHSPENLMIPDSVKARRPVIVASERLASFLSAQMPAGGHELLPITLVNHKKRNVKERYFIVNPLGLQDCLDVKKCGVTWSDIAHDSIDELKRLVIDCTRIDPACSMFRPKYYRELILVRRSLARAIDAAGMTGVAWTELGDYAGD